MQPWHKRLEGTGKRALARVAALAFRRPARALPSGLRRVLLVRVDDRVGEALLTTPLATALKRLQPAPTRGRPRAPQDGARARGAPGGRPHPRRSTGGFSASARSPRASAPSGAPGHGTWSSTAGTGRSRASPRRWSPGSWPAARRSSARRSRPPVRCTTSRYRARADTRSELAQRLHLLSPLLEPPRLLPTFRTPRVRGARWPLPRAAPRRARTPCSSPAAASDGDGFPPSCSAVAARTLAELGRTVIVAWGPGEEELATQRRRRRAPAHASRRRPTSTGSPRCSAAAGCTVCNNSGPMHLSVAVGAPTLALFLRMDPERWGYREPPHAVLDLTAVIEDPERTALEVDRAVRAFVDGARHAQGLTAAV